MFALATGDDTVALRPAWRALLSSPRFAERTRWLFGNGAALLQCIERGPRRWLTERAAADGLRIRFDLRHWSAAYARCNGSAREIGVVADDGSAVALLHLEQADSALDELIWALMSDDTEAPHEPQKRDRLAREQMLERAGPAIARPLAADALAIALRDALAAELPLRLHLQNGGGGVTWTPNGVDLDAATAQIALRAGDVSIRLPRAAGRTWAVDRDTPDACCPALERCAPGDRGWLRIDVAADTRTVCAAWRRICAALAEE